MKNIAIGVAIQIGLLVVFFVLLESKKDKTAFIRLEKVYEDFQLKKDLEAKFKYVESKRKSMLDSLELELKLLYQRISQEKSANKGILENYEAKKETYFVRKQQYSEDNQKLMDQYHSQIISRIGDYSSTFGKLNGYAYIFGTESSGSVMYSKEDMDVTTEFLKFINNSYKAN